MCDHYSMLQQNLNVAFVDAMDTKDSKDAGEGADKAGEGGDRGHCSSLDRIMCQIVDELNCDTA